jgi:glutamate N-acetyltransferase/amino-acid N-acetyltransferase
VSLHAPSTAVRLTSLPGGVCATPGIRASGVAGGLKPSGNLDVALVDAGWPVAAAGVQTRNQVLAHPVTVTTRHLRDGRARAVLLNAGSANVCTGPDGLALAEESARVAAKELGCEPAEVLLCSTGVIGQPIPRDPFLGAIPAAVEALSPDGGSRAAKAIMTTDLVAKEAAFRVEDGAGSCVVGGMVKGSGMIAPSLATMLCVITTDAPVQGPILKAALKDAVGRTFNRISVDECMSTNDAVLVLATGTAEKAPSLSAFKEALTAVCASLAEQVVRDGEGAKKVLHVRVTGARTESDAVEVGRAVAASDLVKTAVAGGDPNWGRILGAMGAGPVRFEPDRVIVTFGGVTVCRFGVAASFDRGVAAQQLRGPDVRLTIDLGLGEAEATFLTCDLTYDYIRINAEYTT